MDDGDESECEISLKRNERFGKRVEDSGTATVYQLNDVESASNRSRSSRRNNLR